MAQIVDFLTGRIMTVLGKWKAADIEAVGIEALPVASQAEAEAGTIGTKVMTPERVAQAIAEQAGQAGGVTYLEISAASPDNVRVWLRLKEDGTVLGKPRYRAYGVDGLVAAEMKVVDMGSYRQWQLTVGAVVWYVGEVDPAAPEASVTPNLVTSWDNNYDDLGKVMTLVVVRNGELLKGRRPRRVTDGYPAAVMQVLDTDGLVCLEDIVFGVGTEFKATVVGGLNGANGTEVVVYNEVNPANRIKVNHHGEELSLLVRMGAVLRLVRLGLNSVVDAVTVGPERRVLNSSVVNNNGTANTLADLTELSFPVLPGLYRFRFVLPYDAAATTTGSRWTINGPAVTRLNYRSVYGLTTTSETVNQGLAAYGLPSAANATSPATTGNVAIIEGVAEFSAAGTLVPRFASEVSGSAITALRGGWGEVERLVM